MKPIDKYFELAVKLGYLAHEIAKQHPHANAVTLAKEQVRKIEFFYSDDYAAHTKTPAYRTTQAARNRAKSTYWMNHYNEQQINPQSSNTP